MTRKFKKLNENATIPERATKHSAGYDISAQMESVREDLVQLGRCKNE